MKLLILGNGKSRLKEQKFINSWNYEIWGCNQIDKEIQNINNLTLIATVHEYYYNELVQFNKKNNLNLEILGPCQFTKFLGFSTGNELIHEALLRGYREIYLIGYDSIFNSNKDIYIYPYPYIENFKKQLIKLIEKYNLILKKYKSNIYIIKNRLFL